MVLAGDDDTVVDDTVVVVNERVDGRERVCAIHALYAMFMRYPNIPNCLILKYVIEAVNVCTILVIFDMETIPTSF